MHNINLPVSTLPSKGYNYTFNDLRIGQMTFSKILNFQAEIERCNNVLSTFLVQLKHLLLSMEHGSEILMYDAIPIMAIRAYNSTSEELTDFIRIKYTCPVHKEEEIFEVKLRNLHFEDMDPLLTKIDKVKINGHEYKFKLPTVEDFIKIAEAFKIKVPVQDSERYIHLLSCFEESYDAKTQGQLLLDLLNATGKDIVTLNKIYELETGAFTGFNVTCNRDTDKEPVTVRINSISPVTDIFQNILATEVFDQTAFSLK